MHRSCRLLAAWLIAGCATLQATPRSLLDPAFHPKVRIAGRVLQAIAQDDGKILIRGDFRAIDGVKRAGFARLEANGGLDAGFQPASGVDRVVDHVLLQRDGRIVLAVSDGTQSYLTRVQPDGSADAAFPAALPFTGGYIEALAQQSDGRLIVAGTFNAVRGASHRGLVRLGADGAVDSGFNPDVGQGGVRQLALQPDGRMVIAGDFTKVNATRFPGMARLDASGSVDPSFQPDVTIDGFIYSVTALDGGGVLVAGDIYINQASVRGLVRLRANGTWDREFLPDLTAIDHDEYVYQVAVQADGRIVIGGQFDRVGGVVRHDLARLRPDGSLDAGFNPSGTVTNVEALAAQAGGNVLIGAYFNEAGGLFQLDSAGAANPTFLPSLQTDGTVEHLLVQPDGKVLAAGTFDRIKKTAAGGVARLDARGRPDPSFRPASGPRSTAFEWVLQSSGQVVFKDDFDGENGAPGHEGIARLNADGTTDSSFRTDFGIYGQISSLVVQADDAIVCAGSFVSVDGVDRVALARFHADGTLDAGFAPDLPAEYGENLYLSVLGLQPDGRIIITGEDGGENEPFHYFLGRRNADGSRDAFTAGADGAISKAVTQPDGKIVIAGGFNKVNGVKRHRIARLNPDGSLDADFQLDLNKGAYLQDLAIDGRGRVVFAGNFNSVNGRRCDGIARLHPDGTLDRGLRPRIRSDYRSRVSVSRLAVAADGSVVFAGDFTIVDGFPRSGVARLPGP